MQRTRDRRATATNMETLAAVAFGLQQPMWAARLLGSAEALREAIGPCSMPYGSSVPAAAATAPRLKKCTKIEG